VLEVLKVRLFDDSCSKSPVGAWNELSGLLTGLVVEQLLAGSRSGTVISCPSGSDRGGMTVEGEPRPTAGRSSGQSGAVIVWSAVSRSEQASGSGHGGGDWVCITHGALQVGRTGTSIEMGSKGPAHRSCWTGR